MPMNEMKAAVAIRRVDTNNSPLGRMVYHPDMKTSFNALSFARGISQEGFKIVLYDARIMANVGHIHGFLSDNEAGLIHVK